jgi:hypothetical protein
MIVIARSQLPAAHQKRLGVVKRLTVAAPMSVHGRPCDDLEASNGKSSIQNLRRGRRQMKAARQLRAETVSRSSAQAIKALRDLARRMVDRIRGTQDLALPH